jgi:hypothetical protein
MAGQLTERAVLTLLSQDDAEGLGYTAATIGTSLLGIPHSPLQAAQRLALAEKVVESLLEQGRLQIAGYLYLAGGKVPRYKPADRRP